MQFLRNRINRTTKNRKIWILPLLLFLLTGCADAEPAEESQTGGVAREPAEESGFTVTSSDLNTVPADAAVIDLRDYKDECVIREAGDYILSGSLNGSIIVDAEEQIVHLFLEDVTVQASYGPAVSVVSAGKVIITLLPDTVSTLSDSGYYPPDGEENACIYSNCDLTVNGGGILNINGYYKDGIHSKDIVKLLGGEVFILAKRNGIRGNDGILLAMEQLTIESEGSGLQSSKTGKAGKGTVEMAGGDITVIAGEYAVTSADDLRIHDCRLYINAVISDFDVAGDSYIQEECMSNE